MVLFPESFTMLVDTNSGPASVVGLARIRGTASFAGTRFEGVIRNDLMERLYRDHEANSLAYLLGGFYQVYFSRLKPVAECADFTYLFGTLRSSEGLKANPPKLVFEDNNSFQGLVNRDCFKDQMFSSFADTISKAIADNGHANVEYHPCIYDGKIGICFNTNLVI